MLVLTEHFRVREVCTVQVDAASKKRGVRERECERERGRKMERRGVKEREREREREREGRKRREINTTVRGPRHTRYAKTTRSFGYFVQTMLHTPAFFP